MKRSWGVGQAQRLKPPIKKWEPVPCAGAHVVQARDGIEEHIHFGNPLDEVVGVLVDEAHRCSAVQRDLTSTTP